MGPEQPAGPYAAVARLLDENVWVQSAANIVANHFPGVNPMEVLRSDDTDWLIWASLVRRSEAIQAQRRPRR